MNSVDAIVGLIGSGGILSAAVAFAMVRANRRKAYAESDKFDAEADSHEADATARLVDSLISGSTSVLVMKQGEVDDLRDRLARLENENASMTARLVDCERHTETITRLEREVDELKDRLADSEKRATRYLDERNQARDELREVRTELRDAEKRLVALERDRSSS